MIYTPVVVGGCKRRGGRTGCHDLEETSTQAALVQPPLVTARMTLGKKGNMHMKFTLTRQ